MVVYKVTNMINGKVYIGKTESDLKVRRAGHYKSVKRGSESNFHPALRNGNRDDFKWEMLGEYNTKEEMDNAEIKYISEYDTFKNGYNMTEGGDGGITYKKGDELYERIKHKLGKWKNGNPGATPEAIAKRVETFSKKTDWLRGEQHPNYGRIRWDMRDKPGNGAKPVIVDGVEYASTGKAAVALGLKDSEVVRHRCNCTRKWKNYNYK